MRATTWQVGEPAHRKFFLAKAYSIVGIFHIQVGKEYNVLGNVAARM